MKIGIVTFHCAYNFGSALQTWALKHKLEQMGHVVSVVDYRGKDFDQYELMRFRSLKSGIASFVFLKGDLARRNSFEAFIQREFNCTERFTTADESEMEALSRRFDCFVCGSDQIWNLDCTSGPVGPYFLSFAGDARRIAYAPSLSHLSFEVDNFNENDRRHIRDWLERFDEISVREKATVPIFQELTQNPIHACIDPTLLHDASAYDHITTDMEEARGSLFVYMLERNNQLVSYAGKLARKMGLRVSYVSRRPVNFGCLARNYYGIGPSEFLGLIRDSDAVLTNSFHATVFSVLFDRPFQTFTTARSGSRMTELLGNLGAADRLTDGTVLNEPVAADRLIVQSSLNNLRASSVTYLERALS